MGGDPLCSLRRTGTQEAAPQVWGVSGCQDREDERALGQEGCGSLEGQGSGAQHQPSSRAGGQEGKEQEKDGEGHSTCMERVPGGICFPLEPQILQSFTQALSSREAGGAWGCRGPGLDGLGVLTLPPSHRRLDPPVGGIQAQTRLRPLRPHRREVLR